MEPLVTPGDVVMIRPVTAAELTPNTVVLFERADDTRVLHRIVEQLPDGTFAPRATPTPSRTATSAPGADPGAAVLAVPWVGRPSLWLSEGRVLQVTATAAALLVVLVLAPRSFDPAYDPWASGRRVNPAEVLLGRTGGSSADRRAAAGRRLPPEKLHGVVWSGSPRRAWPRSAGPRTCSRAVMSGRGLTTHDRKAARDDRRHRGRSVA